MTKENNEGVTPVQNERTSLNKSLATRFQRIVEEIIEENQGDREGVILFRKDDPNRAYSIDISVYYSGEARKRSERCNTLPVDFGMPFVSISETHEDPHYLSITTPYGFLPREGIVKGEDGCLYFLDNIYFLNQYGKSLKSELIFRLGRFDDVELINIKQVEFTPNPEDSRCVELQPGDYEKLVAILTQIEQGEFVE